MLYKTVLTIGHKVGSVDLHTTATICAAVTELMQVSGFTAIPCIGMWEGVPEDSTRIEMVTDEATAAAIVAKVPTLAWQLNQNAIMCESHPAMVTFPESLVPAVSSMA